MKKTIQAKPMKFLEIERIVKGDGWVFEEAQGGHYHYKHSTKSGKVTIPRHSQEIGTVLVRRILKQAGLK